MGEQGRDQGISGEWGGVEGLAHQSARRARFGGRSMAGCGGWGGMSWLCAEGRQRSNMLRVAQAGAKSFWQLEIEMQPPHHTPPV